MKYIQKTSAREVSVPYKNGELDKEVVTGKDHANH
jgi:hypothetical protein